MLGTGKTEHWYALLEAGIYPMTIRGEGLVRVLVICDGYGHRALGTLTLSGELLLGLYNRFVRSKILV